MPQRTISATGGNFGSASAWVEGVVPTTADFIVGLTTSGNLTLNTSFSVQYVDFTNYTGTMNMGIFALTLNLVSATSSFGASTSWTYSISGSSGTSLGDWGRFICTVAHNFSQSGTAILPQFTFGAGTKTLATDLHTRRTRATATVTCNGNTLHIYEAMLSNDETTGNQVYAGTTLYRLRGTGVVSNTNTLTVSCTISQTLQIDGKYVTVWLPLTLGSGATLRTIAGSDTSRLLVSLSNTETTSGETFNFDTVTPLGSIRLLTFIGPSKRQIIINSLNNTLKVNYFLLLPFGQGWYGAVVANSIAEEVRFFGAGVEIQNFISYPFIKFYNTSGAYGTDADSFVLLAPDVKFDAVGTYSVTTLQLIGANSNGTFQSVTASTSAKLQTGTNSYLHSYNVTGIDATFGRTLYMYGSGTISSSPNVLAGPPITASFSGSGFSYIV